MKSNTSRLIVGILAVVVLAAAPLAASAPRVSTALHHDTSLPLTEMHAINAANGVAAPTGLNLEIPNHSGRTLNHQPQGPADIDQNVQRDARPNPMLAPTPAPSIVFEGSQDSDNSGLFGFAIVPPDTEGDVGGDHYLQWINLVYEIFDKNTGATVLGPAPGSDFWIGFGGVCEGSNDGDPIALYDHLASRWVVAQFETGTGIQCVAVSTTPDPLGSYHRYAFQAATPGNLNDYPKMGLWTDSYLYVHDEFAFFFENSVACAFERDPMLSGGAADLVCFDLPNLSNDGVFGPLPADLEGDAPPAGTLASFFMYWDRETDGTAFVDGVRNWTLDLDWSNPGAATLIDNGVVAGAAWDRNLCNFGRSCVPQLGGEGLDTLAAKTMWRAHTRWEGDRQTVLLNSSADPDGSDISGIHWGELENTGGGWSYVQEGTYAPGDGVYRWMGSIAKDASGNICVGYSASNAAMFPSIRYACRSEGDPLGTLPGGEQILKSGTGSQTGSANRWGDYSSLSIDSTNDCDFWFTNEYYQTTSSFNFHTSIGSWTFSDCDGGLSLNITPGISGQDNDWVVAGATPNGLVTVVCKNPSGGIVTVGTDTADGNGDGVVTRFVPGAAAGQTLLCGVEDDVTGDRATASKSFS